MESTLSRFGIHLGREVHMDPELAVLKKAEIVQLHRRWNLSKVYGNLLFVPKMKTSHRVDSPSIFCFRLTLKTRRDRCSAVWQRFGDFPMI